MFPASARALPLPPSGRGVLLGDGTFRLRVDDRHGIMVTIRGQEVGFLLDAQSRPPRPVTSSLISRSRVQGGNYSRGRRELIEQRISPCWPPESLSSVARCLALAILAAMRRAFPRS